jgi:hypothetical protein
MAVNKPLIGVAIAVLVIAIAAGYYWHSQRAPVPVIPTSAASVAPAPTAEDVIEHPVPAARAAAEAPLPALNDSDMAIATALGDAGSGPGVTHYLVPESIIRHLVVTIDNLPRAKVAVAKRPTVPVDGVLLADGDELHATLDADNFKRYAPMVDALRQADMQRVAAVYFRFYPLFQKAYQDLGYPTGYFNDRLVKVIDSLLATPQPTGPVDLVRPNVMYQFADPALESRPAGQKLLLRMGPENAAVVKAKLTELRAIITATPPKQ